MKITLTLLTVLALSSCKTFTAQDAHNVVHAVCELHDNIRPRGLAAATSTPTPQQLDITLTIVE